MIFGPKLMELSKQSLIFLVLFHLFVQVKTLITTHFKSILTSNISGFMALRSTPSTLNMMKKWHQETLNGDRILQDQSVFQNVVFQMNVNYRVLPMKYFTPGEIYFEFMSDSTRREVVFVHNNFLTGKDQKIKRFKHFDLWAPHLEQSKLQLIGFYLTFIYVSFQKSIAKMKN